jgi:hypothetical protein
VCVCVLRVLFLNIGLVRNLNSLEYSCFVIYFILITVIGKPLGFDHGYAPFQGLILTHDSVSGQHRLTHSDCAKADDFFLQSAVNWHAVFISVKICHHVLSLTRRHLTACLVLLWRDAQLIRYPSVCIMKQNLSDVFRPLFCCEQSDTSISKACVVAVCCQWKINPSNNAEI